MFTEVEAREITEALLGIIWSQGFDKDAAQKLWDITNKRLEIILTPWLRDYPLFQAQDAIIHAQVKVGFHVINKGLDQIFDMADEDAARWFVNVACRIVKNDVKNRWNREMKYKGLAKEELDAMPIEKPDDDEFFAALQLALKTLPEREERVVREVLLGQRKGKDVADEMKLTPARVSQLYRQGLAKLSGLLKDFNEVPE